MDKTKKRKIIYLFFAVVMVITGVLGTKVFPIYGAETYCEGEHVFYYSGTNNGTHYVQCENCDYYEIEDCTGSGTWESYEDYHYQTCVHCLNEFLEESHSGGHASCVDQAICDTCGDSYGYLSDEHVPGLWWSDETMHILECELCQDSVDSGEHYGGFATCYEQAACEECGTLYGNLEDHDFIIQADSYNHWYECINCDFVGLSDEHFGSGASCVSLAVCDICMQEYGDYEDHDYVGWFFNDDYHYEECFYCAGIKEYISHSGGVATCDSQAECETCYFSYGALGDHDYGDFEVDGDIHHRTCNTCYDTVSENHFGGEATCTQSAVCAACEIGYGQPLDHIFNTEYRYDNDSHWFNCKTCDLRNTEVNHSGGNATCSSKAVCDICDNGYGDTIQHTYELWSSDSTHHWQECSECDEIRYYLPHLDLVPPSCTNVGYCAECELNYGEILEHRYLDDYSVDDDYHWKKCKDCNHMTDKINHSSSDWVTIKDVSCEQKGYKEKVCDECDKTFETLEIEKLGHSLECVDALESTCTKEGNIKYYSCNRCSDYFLNEDGSNKISLSATKVSLKSHIYTKTVTNPTYYESGFDTFTCKDCNHSYVDNVVPKLTFTINTSSNSMIDDNFFDDYELGTKLESPTKEGYTFKGWFLDSKFKNSIDTITASDLDEERNIVLYPKWDKDGLSGGAIVGIVLGSIVLASGGGFAVYWFIIRKKFFRK